MSRNLVLSLALIGLVAWMLLHRPKSARPPAPPEAATVAIKPVSAPTALPVESVAVPAAMPTTTTIHRFASPQATSDCATGACLRCRLSASILRQQGKEAAASALCGQCRATCL